MPREQAGWGDSQAFFFFPCDIPPSEFNQSLPKSELYTVDPSEGLLSQTEQSLQKPLFCVLGGGHYLTPIVPLKFDPQFPVNILHGGPLSGTPYLAF